MNKKECQQSKDTNDLGCFPPGGGAILAAVIADLLAAGLETDQIAVLAAFITTIGDSLGYIAAQMALNQDRLEGRTKQGGENIENS